MSTASIHSQPALDQEQGVERAKIKRDEDRIKLVESVTSLWKTLNVSEADKKVSTKVENVGGLKFAELSLMKEEYERLQRLKKEREEGGEEGGEEGEDPN